MLISWKTNGSAGAVELCKTRIAEVGYAGMDDYSTWANDKGRTNYKFEEVGSDLVITEEWNITRSEYDALGIIGADQPQADGVTLPLVETTDHLSFA
tara:strand:+ start:96 stop:386 length:291 start_codon:yes stop_codon:yes gene_type:complete